MIERKTWKEFQSAGLLWWVNMILHTFGWVIVLEKNKEGDIVGVYPAETKFRGFDEKTNAEGYEKMDELLKSKK